MRESSQPGTLAVDIDSVRLSPSEQIWGRIYFVLKNDEFPDKSWDDFVVHILGWWLSEVLENDKGDLELTFMDGPYHVLLKKPLEGDLWHADCIRRRGLGEEVEASIPISLSGFLTQLLEVSITVVQKCESSGWKKSEIEAVRKLAGMLSTRLGRA